MGEAAIVYVCRISWSELDGEAAMVCNSGAVDGSAVHFRKSHADVLKGLCQFGVSSWKNPGKLTAGSYSKDPIDRRRSAFSFLLPSLAAFSSSLFLLFRASRRLGGQGKPVVQDLDS